MSEKPSWRPYAGYHAVVSHDSEIETSELSAKQRAKEAEHEFPGLEASVETDNGNPHLDGSVFGPKKGGKLKEIQDWFAARRG